MQLGRASAFRPWGARLAAFALVPQLTLPLGSPVCRYIFLWGRGVLRREEEPRRQCPSVGAWQQLEQLLREQSTLCSEPIGRKSAEQLGPQRLRQDADGGHVLGHHALKREAEQWRRVLNQPWRAGRGGLDERPHGVEDGGAYRHERVPEKGPKPWDDAG